MSTQKPTFILEFEKPLQALEATLQTLKDSSHTNHVDVAAEIQAIEKKIEATKHSIYSNLTAWQRVQVARHPQRPYALDYIEHIFEGFEELAGDRLFGNDEAIVGGPAYFRGMPIMVIGTQKGRSTKEKIARNFGAPHPEGYRKALRLMHMADRFQLPIITLIDTAGAYPGVASEERHIAEAIAVNLREMIGLQVPIIAVIIGEGGSGGALGIGVADTVLIMEHAYYSVISPEGCAAILWKDRAFAPEAADALKISAQDLMHLKIVDEIISEPIGGAHLDHKAAAQALARSLETTLGQLAKLSCTDLLENRYQKYRAIGVFETLPAS